MQKYRLLVMRQATLVGWRLETIRLEPLLPPLLVFLAERFEHSVFNVLGLHAHVLGSRCELVLSPVVLEWQLVLRFALRLPQWIAVVHFLCLLM